MKLLFYKSLLLFFAFTGGVLAQKHVVYHKAYSADKNTVLNIDLDKINIAIEESTDGKIHFDYGLEFENYSKKEKQRVIDRIKINTIKDSDIINLKGYSETEVTRVSYSFDLSHVIIDAPYVFKGKNKKKNSTKAFKKSKDSILKEIRFYEETSLKKLLERFKFKDESGKIKKVKTKDVKIMKSKFLVRIPAFVKLNIKAKESSTFLNFDYQNKLTLDIDGGKFKSKRLYNTNNTFKIINATALLESVSGKTLDLKNVSKSLLGEVSNISINSESSRIEIGEVQENVSLSDYDSDYFLYGYSNNFKRSDFMGIYSEIHFFEPETDYTLEVFGHDTTFYFDNNTVISQPSKDGKIKKMMDRKLRKDKPFSGKLEFTIIHSNFYYPTELTPNKNN